MHTQYQKHDVSPTPPTQPHANGAVQNSLPETLNAASIDDLISSASKQAEVNAAATQSSLQPSSKTEASISEPANNATAPAPNLQGDAAEDKIAKKEKDKPKTTRLVYSDNDTSPEEKMAVLARYYFTPEQRTITA